MGDGMLFLHVFPPTLLPLYKNDFTKTLLSGCTVNALKHRIQRIKEKAGLTSSVKAGASNSPSGLKTKRATTMKAKKASPKRKPTLPKTSERDNEKRDTSECEKEIHDEDQLA